MNQGGALFPKKQLIEKLQPGDKVDWYYRILECEKKKKKDGGDFLTLTLMDRSGRIPGKIWENTQPHFQIIQKGNIYRIKGEVTEYNGKKEMRILRVAAVSGEEKDFDTADYLETAPFDTETLLAETQQILREHLQNPHLIKLIEEFFHAYTDTLKSHLGAQKIHHAYPGGLLEHTCSLLKLAIFVADHYGLDKELLLSGAVFHDIGKVMEFQVQPAPETTLEGGLLGHVILSHRIFLDLSQRVEGFPKDLSLKIQHLIISHHGEKEFGSPEVPKMPEAYALHMLDMLDSRLNIYREISRRAENKGLFSEYINALGTRILLDKE